MKEEYDILPVEEAKTIIYDSTIDLTMDISETCIDAFFDESIVKDIPVLGTFYKVGKIGYSIGRITYIKKLLVFAQEIQRNTISSDKLKDHKELLQSNPKKFYKELELIIQYLQRQVGYEKAVYNARVYYMYLEGEIDYDDLELLWEIIDQFYMSDKKFLEELYSKDFIESGNKYNQVACKRLSNCGLIDFFNGMTASDPESGKKIIARIGYLGKFFCENILNVNLESKI